MNFKYSRRSNQLPYSQINETGVPLEKIRNSQEPFIFTNISVEGGNLVPSNTIEKVPYSQINNITSFWNRPGLEQVNNKKQQSENSSVSYKTVVIVKDGSEPLQPGDNIRNNTLNFTRTN